MPAAGPSGTSTATNVPTAADVFGTSASAKVSPPSVLTRMPGVSPITTWSVSLGSTHTDRASSLVSRVIVRPRSSDRYRPDDVASHRRSSSTGSMTTCCTSTSCA